MALAGGATFGPYRIVSRLGGGGMGVVYRAHDPSLDRHVALKVLPDDSLDNEQALARFRLEARAVARLVHPNILPVLAFGIQEPTHLPWMALQLIENGSLAALLLRGPLSPRRALGILRGIATALDHAHTQGVVHRDVKPHNVLIAAGDHVYLADFGLARILEASTMLSASGAILGTPQYMAPEQAQGREVDHRCDIYALGVLAYELFSGHPPFQADTPMAVLMKHVREPVPLPARMPEPLREPVWKALAKQPGERWPTALAFVDALERGFDPLAAAHPEPAAGAAADPRSQPSAGPLSPEEMEQATLADTRAARQPPPEPALPTLMMPPQPPLQATEPGLAGAQTLPALPAAIFNPAPEAPPARALAVPLLAIAGLVAGAVVATLRMWPIASLAPAPPAISVAVADERPAEALASEPAEPREVALPATPVAAAPLSPSRPSPQILVSAVQPPAPLRPPGEPKQFADGLYVWVPAGTFTMGCTPEDGDCDVAEMPAHSVTLTHGYYMARTEVTRAQYSRSGLPQPPEPEFPQGQDHPVVNVSLEAATRYCAVIGGRLPTEAEWERAARGGHSGWRYPWGNAAGHEHANYGAEACCTGLASGRDRWEASAPVGQFPPNDYGLVDIAGNVWEWTADRQRTYAAGPLRDPRGNGAPQVRGGSWDTDPGGLRVSGRLRLETTDGIDSIGFRCVRDAVL